MPKPATKFGPPGPSCKRGHKFTPKTTRWRITYSTTGLKYVQASCRRCESAYHKLNYQRRVAASQLAAGLAARDVDQISRAGLAGGFGVHGVDFGLGVKLDGAVPRASTRD